MRTRFEFKFLTFLFVLVVLIGLGVLNVHLYGAKSTRCQDLPSMYSS